MDPIFAERRPSTPRAPIFLELSDLAPFLVELRSQGKNIGLCHGCFDLVHPGHLDHFEYASRFCDTLLVSITADRFIFKGPGRPLFNEELRAKSLAAVRFIEGVVVSRYPTAIQVLEFIRPNLYFKGIDYADESKDRTGMITKEREAVESQGGKLFVTPTFKMSSTEIIGTFSSPAQ